MEDYAIFKCEPGQRLKITGPPLLDEIPGIEGKCIKLYSDYPLVYEYVDAYQPQKPLNQFTG